MAPRSISLPIPNYVGGRWTASTSTQSLSLTNPATGELLGHVPLSTRDDVAAAVSAARNAFPAWRDLPAVDRVQVLFRLKGLLERHLPDLAELMTREHGKTKDESLGELRRGVESVTHACS